MKLADYLESNSLSRAEFAEKISVSPEAVRRYVTGERAPDKERLIKIAEVTGGEVTANDFFGIAA